MGRVRFGQYEARRLAAAYEAHHQAYLRAQGRHDRPDAGEALVKQAAAVVAALRAEYGLEADPDVDAK